MISPCIIQKFSLSHDHIQKFSLSNVPLNGIYTQLKVCSSLSSHSFFFVLKMISSFFSDHSQSSLFLMDPLNPSHFNWFLFMTFTLIIFMEDALSLIPTAVLCNLAAVETRSAQVLLTRFCSLSLFMFNSDFCVYLFYWLL